MLSGIGAHNASSEQLVYHVSLCVNGELGNIDLPPDQTNIGLLHESFKNLKRLENLDNLCALYQPDPLDNNDWAWWKRLLAYGLQLSVAWATDDAYRKVVEAVTEMARQDRLDPLHPFKVELHLAGARAGGTLVRRLSNLINANLEKDLRERNLRGFKGFYIQHIVLFDCSDTARKEKPIVQSVLEDLFISHPQSKISHDFEHLNGKVGGIWHFVAADESDKNQGVLLIDRSTTGSVPLKEVWSGGDRFDPNIQDKELAVALNALSADLGGNFKTEHRRRYNFRERAKTNNHRVIRVLNKFEQEEGATIAVDTMSPEHLARIKRQYAPVFYDAKVGEYQQQPTFTTDQGNNYFMNVPAFTQQYQHYQTTGSRSPSPPPGHQVPIGDDFELRPVVGGATTQIKVN